MAEWLVEEGIGEERAVLSHNDRILAARLQWPGGLTAGQVEDARLVSRGAGLSRGTARFASGEEALVDGLPPSATEGSLIRLKVTRARLHEADRRKMALARPTTEPLQAAPGMAEQLAAEEHAVRVVRRFPAALDWRELWLEAQEGYISFGSGTLLLYPTPAMTLIDIDGVGDAPTLAQMAVAPLAAALRRLDLSGNIGIDFPTIADKVRRKAVDEALGEALADWPHERTAINGFGFVQIVARMERPSLLSVIAHEPARAAARHLLREAEGLEGAGAVLLRCSASVSASLRPEWLNDLQRRMGRAVRVEVYDNRLDPEGGHAQLVPHD